ncbi:DUF4221 family protein [uncultured Roseivirga sp.]|uniref:DUF4221 family protein n=1 Tax=uncultured Roseivirga sp. TaxID=543088 RepID=UPI0030DB340B|tara:strand:+ start:602 stop:1732 length:1131 start_codon:yes stop_codon:yes gene_type:complete
MKFSGISNRIKIFSLAFCIISLSLEAQTAKQVVYGDDFVFKLDFKTSYDAYGPVKYKNFYAFFTYQGKTINFYDQKTLESAGTISIAQEGPNAERNPSGLFTDGDQLYVFNHYQSLLSAIDMDGKASTAYRFKQEDHYRGSYVPFRANLVFSDETFIYIPYQPGVDFKTKLIDHSYPTVLRINKADSSITTFLNYPSNYKNIISGGFQSFIITAFNTKTSSLFVSYPLSHTVLELTKNGQVKGHLMQSKEIDGFENHYFKSESELKTANIKIKFLKNPSYWRLHYDSYSDTYWRFINLPLTYSQMNQKEVIEAEARNYKVVVFDANFKKIAESDILKDINLTLLAPIVFSTEKGIHIYAKSQENEEEMRFKTLKIK